MMPAKPQSRSEARPTPLHAYVRSVGYKEHRGLVAATQDDVATVDFQRASAPFFPVAQEISVTFRSTEIFQPFVARSRVIMREDDVDHLHYKLRFNEQDGQTVCTLFKRRASPRVVPDESFPIEVGDAEHKGATLTARLRDISTQGLSFYIHPASVT
jgi:hypothetical protein